jgi:hypothetical protein
VPIEVFDGIRAGSLADRSQQYKDLADGPFFGLNIEGAKLITYEGAPHGITDTHKERLGNDLLEFLRS